MENLKTAVELAVGSGKALPFACFSSVYEQRIANVPISRPLLVCVLDGCKQLLGETEVTGQAGDFLLLSNHAALEMRNVPSGNGYRALLIEFEYEDFLPFIGKGRSRDKYLRGELSPLLSRTLTQFVEWATWAPQHLWPLRRQEILHALWHEGFHQIGQMIEPPGLSHQIYNRLAANPASDPGSAELAAALAMSESTLRRRLRQENTSLTTLRDQARLGVALTLLQTTELPVAMVAERCGYQSHSRFTDRFRQTFGLTPSELRKTRMTG